ncbi:MAG: hypothetical protein ABR886_06265 [Dehalococcoidales bacterium]
MGKKKLTIGESKILALIQEEYGPQNTEKDVIRSDSGEAVIFAKDVNGVPYKLINLTNVAAMCENGTIKSEQELISKWIHISDDK